MAVQDRPPPVDELEAADRAWKLTEVRLLPTALNASLTLCMQVELADWARYIDQPDAIVLVLRYRDLKKAGQCSLSFINYLD